MKGKKMKTMKNILKLFMAVAICMSCFAYKFDEEEEGVVRLEFKNEKSLTVEQVITVKRIKENCKALLFFGKMRVHHFKEMANKRKIMAWIKKELPA